MVGSTPARLSSVRSASTTPRRNIGLQHRDSGVAWKCRHRWLDQHLASSMPGGGAAEAKLSGLVDGHWDRVRIMTVQRTAS